MSESITSQKSLILLLLVLGTIWFVNLDYRKLTRPDEGRYAEISREMVTSGDWLTPRLNDIKYFEKPPLQYWTTAAAYKIFGEHEWTARLWSALTGFLEIVLIYFGARRIFDERSARYAALALGSFLLYFGIAHLNTLDMGVTFFMSLSLIGFLVAQNSTTDDAKRRRWMYLVWLAMGGAVLSKGLIGVVIPAGSLILYSLMQRDWQIWRRLHLLTGMALFFLVTTPWFIAISIKNPEFPAFFFIHEHFQRFATTDHHRYQPFWYFVPILLLGAFPWTITALDAIWQNAKLRISSEQFQAKRLILAWIVFVFLFFSISNSKLASYILPMFPALALLLGSYLSIMSKRRLLWQGGLTCALIGVALMFSPYIVDKANEEVPAILYQHFLVWILVAGVIFLFGCLASLYLIYRARNTIALVVITVSALLSEQLLLIGHNDLAPAHSAYYIAQQIQPYLKPNMPFYSVKMYEQTLPFYIKRTVTLVNHRDEMSFGLSTEPRKWISDMPRFKEVWRSQPYALAIMPPDVYKDLLHENFPMQMVAHDTRHVVVKTL